MGSPPKMRQIRSTVRGALWKAASVRRPAAPYWKKSGASALKPPRNCWKKRLPTSLLSPLAAATGLYPPSQCSSARRPDSPRPSGAIQRRSSARERHPHETADGANGETPFSDFISCCLFAFTPHGVMYQKNFSAGIMKSKNRSASMRGESRPSYTRAVRTDNDLS